MATRMKEADRVRGTKRLALLIENCAQHGYIVCEYCNEVTMTPNIDHFIARANGGAAKDITNCLVACPACNQRKGDRTAAEVFGAEVQENIAHLLATREFTTDIWEAARIIFKISKVTEKQIEMIYNLVRGEVGQ